MLATLEDDRKTIARLSADNARNTNTDAKLRTLVGQRDDLRQELDAAQKRANAAEGKAKRATERLGACYVTLSSPGS